MKKNNNSSKNKKKTYKKKNVVNKTYKRWKRRVHNFMNKLKKTAIAVCIIGILLFVITAFTGRGTAYRTSLQDMVQIQEIHIVEDVFGFISDLMDDVSSFLSRIMSILTSIEKTIQTDNKAESIQLDTIPEYEGIPYVEINNNIPSFTEEEIKKKSYEYYSELDLLGRCGVTMACIGRDIMPTEERGAIGMVKPTGWKLKKYDIVDGKYVYNRCHLIGYQLTGENANVKNLITGTRYMNVEGMLSFENETAEYVRKTGNHVMYRVTPIFEGNNLLASGVQMEAYSVEDKGAGISFNVYVYNVQPGITIDYATGDNWLAE